MLGKNTVSLANPSSPWLTNGQLRVENPLGRDIGVEAYADGHTSDPTDAVSGGVAHW